MKTPRPAAIAVLSLICIGLLGARPLTAQLVRVGDLTQSAEEIPVRLVGYGLVSGLDGTGDRVVGGFSSGHTVRSVANLLRNFGIEVPEQFLRTRNVAAVLVTSETSPYLRPGGRFEVHVSSIGDAISLRGGVLWITPLVYQAGGTPMATAQGPLLISEGDPSSRYGPPIVETTARIPEGGLLEQSLPRPDFAGSSGLRLRKPDIGTAAAIANAINGALGAETATIEDPGAITLALADSTAGGRALLLDQIRELTVTMRRTAQVIIDGRDGTVVAGGNIQVGEAVVSLGEMTLTIGASASSDLGAPGAVRVSSGASVQDVAAALHAVAAPPQSIASVFESLREIGAITARVIIR